MPTAVAGIALTTVYAPNGWLGAPLEKAGIKVAFTPLGITLALTFIGLPFVVRTLQPVLESLDPEVEEAAASLGASRLQTDLPRGPARALPRLDHRASPWPSRAASASTAPSSSSPATCR